MKITTKQLKQIIKEEVTNLREARSKPGIDHGRELPGQDTGYEHPEDGELGGSITDHRQAAEVFVDTLLDFLETNAPGLADDQAEVEKHVVAILSNSKLL